MKFAYSTTLFRTRSLQEAIEGIGRAGFCSIEVVADTPHAFPEELGAGAVAALNECLQKRKMKICSLNAAAVTGIAEAPNPSWIEEDWQLRELRIRYTLDCMRLAAALGVPQVSTQGGGEIHPSMTRQDAWRLLVANMHRVLPVARKLGVRLLIEPSPGHLIETSSQAREMLQELEFNEYLKVNLDVGNCYAAGEDPCEAYRGLAPHVHHIQLCDVEPHRLHRHAQLGEGSLDIAGFLTCLEKAGYPGYVTIELDTYDKRAEDAVAASAQYLWEKGFLPKEPEPCKA